jgi:hypothetical protein
MIKGNQKNKVKTSLLNLKRNELKDITLLDINYRTVISFSLLGEEIPILIKLEDIKYKDIRSDFKVRGKEVPIISSILLEEGNNVLVDTLFNSIEWKAFDILDDEYYSEKVKEIEKKHTKNFICNRYLIDKEISELEKEVIYNLKIYILEKSLVEKELQSELVRIYMKIRDIQNNIINEFNDVIDNIMNFDDDKSINFNDYFLVMLKTGIMSKVPLFKENLGKSFDEYSYREIKLRISFEHKETLLNANKMRMMMPIMARSLLF